MGGGGRQERLKEKKRLFKINRVSDISPTPNTEWKRSFSLEWLVVKGLRLSFHTHYNFGEGFVPRETFQLSKM